jgi:hypothetical protein
MKINNKGYPLIFSIFNKLACPWLKIIKARVPLTLNAQTVSPLWDVA